MHGCHVKGRRCAAETAASDRAILSTVSRATAESARHTRKRLVRYRYGPFRTTPLLMDARERESHLRDSHAHVDRHPRPHIGRFRNESFEFTSDSTHRQQGRDLILEIVRHIWRIRQNGLTRIGVESSLTMVRGMLAASATREPIPRHEWIGRERLQTLDGRHFAKPRMSRVPFRPRGAA